MLREGPADQLIVAGRGRVKNYQSFLDMCVHVSGDLGVRVRICIDCTE